MHMSEFCGYVLTAIISDLPMKQVTEESKLKPSFMMSCSTKVMTSHQYSLIMNNLHRLA